MDSNQNNNVSNESVTNHEENEENKKENIEQVTEGVDKETKENAEQAPVAECVKKEEEGIPLAQPQDVTTDGREALQATPRTVKRGRSLRPPKEEPKTAPMNFVDVPDYGYVGLDGSFQVPF